MTKIVTMLEDGRFIGEQVVSKLSDLCLGIEIAGSIRRGKPLVNDVEIVALPKHRGTLLARVDGLVIKRVIRKAVYGEAKTERWGDKYRGFYLRGHDTNIELFIGDEHNIGSLLWLRTGPGDSNQLLMSLMIRYGSPYRAKDGDWWHGNKKISVPTEKTLFDLWGMPYLDPKDRTEENYQKYLGKRKWGEVEAYAPAEHQPQAQMSMF